MMPKTTSARWLAGIAFAVGLLAVVSVVVSLTTGSTVAELLPENTAEGTVQRYIVAFDEGELDVAYRLLSDELAQSCALPEFRRSQTRFRDTDSRVRLAGTRQLNGTTEVTVDVTNFSGSPPFGAPPFDTGERTSTYRYLLEQTDDGWRFVDPPWPYYPCPIIRVTPEPPPTPTPAPGQAQEG